MRNFLREIHKLQTGKKRIGENGFSMIEMLVVIAIIGMIASIITASMNSARKKSRIAKRLADLREVQTAIEKFYADNGAYPNTADGWRSQCSAWGSYTNANVVPGLTPTYMAVLPQDPQANIATSNSCYLYRSDGTNYKFMDYYVTEMTNAEIGQYPEMRDNRYSSGGSCSSYDNHSLSVYSNPWICQW